MFVFYYKHLTSFIACTTDMFQYLKSLFEKRPPEPSPEFRHPVLGLLTFDNDSDLWSGEVHRDGRDIPFFIGGRECPPNSTLTNAFLRFLDRFPQTENSALRLLCPPNVPDVPVTKNEFTFQTVNFLSPATPDNFTLEFTMKGDPDAIWRVEFNAGEPTHSGRDD